MKLVFIAGYMWCIIWMLCGFGELNNVPLGNFDVIRDYYDLGGLVFFSGVFAAIFGFAYKTYCDWRGTK